MNGSERSTPDRADLNVEGEVWRYEGPSGWYFIRLNDADSAFVDELDGAEIVGLGYVRVTARLGETEWRTTLFPEKSGGYLLAIKAQVRKQESVIEGDCVDVALTFR